MGGFLMKSRILIIFLLLISISACSSDDLSVEENMVFIEGGEFLLGKEGRTSHLVKVRLDDYYISKFETTVEQWEQFLQETGMPYLWKDDFTDIRKESPYPESPIGVNWKQAIMYANWVSKKYGLEECYVIDGNSVDWNRAANGYRLLTDAEWEYAARGGNKSKNYVYSGSNILDDVAWTWWNSEGIAQRIGTKKANELGLYDMSGNADEWCWDLSWEYPYSPKLSLDNPTGPSINDYLLIEKHQFRISRGGSAGGSEEFFFTTYDRAGLYELSIGAGGPGIRLARNAE